MRIVALVEKPDHVCCRYRLAAFQPYLEEAGHRLELRPWPKSCWSRLRVSRTVEEADAVIIQRRLLPPPLLYQLRARTRRLIFDFDDAVYLRNSYSSKGLVSPQRLLAFAAMCESADVVAAGNTHLRDQAARWTTPDRAHVVPTCVNATEYHPAVHTRKGPGVQLVWIGSTSTVRGLEQIAPVLERVGRKCRGVVLKVICKRFPKYRELAVSPRPWRLEDEASELGSADIGISWLPDDGWSLGKCGLKVLQYMAAGLPVVANPVGMQAHLVRHGENGYLVQTAEQWVEAVSRLMADPALRARMGQAGRQRVEEEFSVASAAPAWLRLVAPARLGRMGDQRRAAA
jgi:glycosyltransferase involved in cell wall biosynthesis